MADSINESHRLAEGTLHPNNGLADEVYFHRKIGIFKQRLEEAGLRLAQLLNDCLAPGSWAAELSQS